MVDHYLNLGGVYVGEEIANFVVVVENILAKYTFSFKESFRVVKQYQLIDSCRAVVSNLKTCLPGGEESLSSGTQRSH